MKSLQNKDQGMQNKNLSPFRLMICPFERTNSSLEFPEVVSTSFAFPYSAWDSFAHLKHNTGCGEWLTKVGSVD